MLDYHTIPPITTDDVQAHRAIPLTYVLLDCSRQHPARYVAPFFNFDLCSIEIESANAYLNTTNWRTVFQNSRTVDDSVSVFMYIFNDITRFCKPR